MKAFISGIPEEYLKGKMFPILEEYLGLGKDSRFVHYDIRTSRSTLNKLMGINLIVLGGGIDKTLKRGEEDYESAISLTLLNRIIPSIILVEDNKHTLDKINTNCPPHLGCSFDDFANCPEEKLKQVLAQILRREKTHL